MCGTADNGAEIIGRPAREGQVSGVNYQWQDKTGPLWGMGLPARTRIYLRRREYYIYNPGGRRVAACPVRL